MDPWIVCFVTCDGISRFTCGATPLHRQQQDMQKFQQLFVVINCNLCFIGDTFITISIFGIKLTHLRFVKTFLFNTSSTFKIHFIDDIVIGQVATELNASPITREKVQELTCLVYPASVYKNQNTSENLSHRNKVKDPIEKNE